MMSSSMPPPPTDKSKSSSASAAAMWPPEQQVLKCPRCDSPNTKFCYYNNYSLTQPRHFCKTCRRYWTKGGALRNVPVGGGCRKSKKSKCSSSHRTDIISSSSSSSSLVPQLDPIANFHLGSMLPYYPVSGAAAVYDGMLALSSNRVSGGSIASSIESLSSMNQDLHWKLQQQRLQAMLFGGEIQKQITATPNLDSFQVAESCKKGVENDTTSAWFLENSFNMPNTNINNTATATATATATNNNGGIIISSSNENNTSDQSGIPAWSDMHHFTSLP